MVVGRTFGRGKDQAREEEGAWCHLMWQFGFTAVRKLGNENNVLVRKFLYVAEFTIKK